MIKVKVQKCSKSSILLIFGVLKVIPRKLAEKNVSVGVYLLMILALNSTNAKALLYLGSFK